MKCDFPGCEDEAIHFRRTEWLKVDCHALCINHRRYLRKEDIDYDHEISETEYCVLSVMET